MAGGCGLSACGLLAREKLAPLPAGFLGLRGFLRFRSFSASSTILSSRLMRASRSLSFSSASESAFSSAARDLSPLSFASVSSDLFLSFKTCSDFWSCFIFAAISRFLSFSFLYRLHSDINPMNSYVLMAKVDNHRSVVYNPDYLPSLLLPSLCCAHLSSDRISSSLRRSTRGRSASSPATRSSSFSCRRLRSDMIWRTEKPRQQSGQ